ncbi:phosphate/phosphite/phosphonate ABC transporter substrate-binding protein [Halalkalibacter alkaliphilus]|uniref:Phosphate/phosphite/phosphonate ABC transporter substrate-binding protein n=1 Tax=Halalkalibacter alkaliphilus TaxID=2917993 RepID=A0A9X2A2Q4_9BACI|nr:phosphate/phosphite/phosphonate ABC transporter substrate-binding protein [Halalkalibacter alkaliphilus]MCL7746855.1 phosphate/phosphite/phosphonate ABC transporter substrate-binding protein [Halalkalibacter alkaliphilus]
MKKFLLLLLVSVFSISLLVACGGGNASQSSSDEQAGNDEWPDKFVYGLLPGEDPTAMSNRWDPMREYLEERLGIEVEFFQGTDYTAMIEAMRAGHVHGAHFGPFAYVLANERADIEAFSMGVKSIEEATYNSIIVTLEDSGIETVEDLEGKDFAWVDPTSASGHMFPKAMLIEELGMSSSEVDSWFGNVLFAGGHDAALLSVLNGDVDAAGVADFIIGNLKDTHGDHPNYNNIKIIATTDDIPRGPDAYLSSLPEDLKEEIREAFYDMVDQPELSEFLEAANFQGGWIPATDEDFDIMRRTAEALGMSPDDLLN